MLQNTRVTAFTVSELSRENQQGVKLARTQIRAKVRIVSVEMFASCYYTGIFVIFSVVIETNVEWCFRLTNVLNVADITF